MLATTAIAQQTVLSAAPLVQELTRLNTIIAAVNAGTHATQIYVNEPSGIVVILSTPLPSATLLSLLTTRQQALQTQLTALGVSVT